MEKIKSNNESINGKKAEVSKQRTEKPNMYPDRFEVNDNEVNWSSECPDYQPPYFVAQVVLENDRTKNKNGWADSEDGVGLKDKSYFSYEGDVLVDDLGRPLNPKGRTGIEGRGLLGNWGANFAADPIVTKEHDGKVFLLVIKRGDTGEWALPGGMVDRGERATQAVERELIEEALNGSQEEPQVLKDKIKSIFSNAEVVYQGHVDDPRNTDNAWMETDAFHVRLSSAEFASFVLEAGDDASDVTWLELTDENIDSLYASHAELVRKAGV